MPFLNIQHAQNCPAKQIYTAPSLYRIHTIQSAWRHFSAIFLIKGTASPEKCVQIRTKQGNVNVWNWDKVQYARCMGVPL
jgi:hypothetical protein